MQNSRTIVHTLGFNLTSEVEQTVRSLYEQNDKKDFQHVLVDLGFPLTDGKIIPQNIAEAKEINNKTNRRVAEHFGSQFMALKNTGVSQNWEMVRQYMSIGDNDALICADPDERPKNRGWVKAVSDVLLSGENIAWCSLMMKEHLPYMKNHDPRMINGHKVYMINGVLNWAQGGFSGKFLNLIGGVQVPKGAPIYGWIEEACTRQLKQLNYRVAILADYFVEHTECSPLYRAWKTDITTHVAKGQIDFETWLRKKSS